MNFLRLFPVILSALALSAHFYRARMIPFVILSLLILILLFYKKKWVARFTQVFLVLGALEWIRTLIIFTSERRMLGLPWGRLVLILGGVALFTAASALVFLGSALKERYKLS